MDSRKSFVKDVRVLNLLTFRCFQNVSQNPKHNGDHFASLRAASPKYRLNQEIAKKWNFFKLAQNKGFRALVTKKKYFKFVKSISDFLTKFFLPDAQNRPKSMENRLHIQRLITAKVKIIIKN